MKRDALSSKCLSVLESRFLCCRVVLWELTGKYEFQSSDKVLILIKVCRCALAYLKVQFQT